MRHDLLLNIQARAVSFFLPGRAAREREERDGHFRNIGEMCIRDSQIAALPDAVDVESSLSEAVDQVKRCV